MGALGKGDGGAPQVGGVGCLVGEGVSSVGGPVADGFGDGGVPGGPGLLGLLLVGGDVDDEDVLPVLALFEVVDEVEQSAALPQRDQPQLEGVPQCLGAAGAGGGGGQEGGQQRHGGVAGVFAAASFDLDGAVVGGGLLVHQHR